MASIEATIEDTLDQADKLFIKGGPALKQMLAGAEKALADKLQATMAAHGGPTGKYTESAARLNLSQVKLATQYVEKRLLGQTHDQAMAAVRSATSNTIKLAKGLEKSFTGITKSLNIEQAGALNPTLQATKASLLSRHRASTERYGTAMVSDFEKAIQTGLLAGATNGEVMDTLVSIGAKGGINSKTLHEATPGYFPEPTGFVRKSYWAERIVRTETAHAYNRANLDTLQELRTQDWPDMGKKILATFDRRTAPDSIAVHGQIRKLEDYFMDGAGRQYLHPPGRPNDRETIIPWRVSWPELPNTKPVPPEEQAKAKQAAQPKPPDQTDAQKRQQMRKLVAEQKAAQTQAAQQHIDAVKTKRAPQAEEAQFKAKQTPLVEAQRLPGKLQAAQAKKAAAQEAASTKAQEALAKAKAYKENLAAKAAEEAKQLQLKTAQAHVSKLAMDPKKRLSQELFTALTKKLQLEGSDLKSAKTQAYDVLKTHHDVFGKPGAPHPKWLQEEAYKLGLGPKPTVAKKEPPAPKFDPHNLPLPEGTKVTPVGVSAAKHLEGATYVDVFDKNGTKVAIFFEKGGKFIVKPPAGLGLDTVTFETAEKAAPYALHVKGAMEANAGKLAAAKAEQEAAEAAERAKLRSITSSARDKQLAEQREHLLDPNRPNPSIHELPVLPAFRSEDVRKWDGTVLTQEHIQAQSRAAGAAMQDARRNSVSEFTGSNYRAIRATEQTSTPGELKPLKDRGAVAKRISAGLAEAHAAGHAATDLEVWRGTHSMPRKLVEEYLAKGEFQHWGTASSSYDQSVATSFGNMTMDSSGFVKGWSSGDKVHILYRMRNKTGVPVETYSRHSSEAEVLLPAGARYKLTNVYYGHESKSVIVVEGEEL